MVSHVQKIGNQQGVVEAPTPTTGAACAPSCRSWVLVTFVFNFPRFVFFRGTYGDADADADGTYIH